MTKEADFYKEKFRVVFEHKQRLMLLKKYYEMKHSFEYDCALYRSTLFIYKEEVCKLKDQKQKIEELITSLNWHYKEDYDISTLPDIYDLNALLQKTKELLKATTAFQFLTKKATLEEIENG